MMRLLYSALLHLALPWLWLRLRLRGRREPGYLADVGQRFGHFVARPELPVIWVHAVSVGETRAARPLIAALRSSFPDHALLVTHLTATGRESARELYGEFATLAFLPYDLPWAIRRFVAHFRPRIGILMETEVWPNLVHVCERLGVPLVLANARMSARSARGYQAVAGLARPAFAALAAVCAQSDADAGRIRALGAREVTVTGNLKFDIEPDPEQSAAGRAWRKALPYGRVLLLASTREAEEAQLLAALGAHDDGTLVVLVPRHPQRFEEVAALARRMGFALARRSLGEAPRAGVRVYLGDTMGEMAFYYALADVAVIGGSFEPLGGQNLIEACAAGVPVIVGPHMFNFADATRLALEAQAAAQAPDAGAAIVLARSLLADAERRARMGEAGRRLCAAHRGAAARHLAICRALLKEALSKSRGGALRPERGAG